MLWARHILAGMITSIYGTQRVRNAARNVIWEPTMDDGYKKSIISFVDLTFDWAEVDFQRNTLVRMQQFCLVVDRSA